MPFIPDQPFPKVQGSTIRSKDWNDLVTEVQRLDAAKVNRAGDALTGPLSITGGNFDLANTEGDLKIGSAASRLKIGVVTTGSSAGDARIRSHGGTNRLLLGSGTVDTLSVLGDRVGVGIASPSARLSISTTGAELTGAARSQVLLVTAGALSTGAGAEIPLASLGFLSGNNSMLGVRARRMAAGSDWTTTAIGLSMDVDNSIRAGASLWLNAAGHVGINGGRWDLTNTEGDLAIGDATYRLKFGVALGGGGAGDARIRAQGGTGRLILGSGTLDVLAVLGSNVGIGTVNPNVRLDVAGDVRLNDNTIYFRGGADNNHGLGWRASYGQVNFIDGPLLYGWSGGALGTLSAGARVALYWDTNNNVRVFGTLFATAKSFLIDHPLDPENKYLRHTSLEGPEPAVFYRGEAQLVDGHAEIVLPDYFEALTRKAGRTVLLTPRFEGREPVSILAATAVEGGRFHVKSIDGKNPSQAFYWEVKAVRADITDYAVEQPKPRVR